MPYVEILGNAFGFRRVTRKELREIEEHSQNPFDFEDELVVTCVTEVPVDFVGWTDCLAGIPSELSKAILTESGYADDNTDFQNLALSWSETPEARLDILISFCFPSISIDALDNMDPLIYCKYAVAARLIVQNIYQMDPTLVTRFLDPNGPDPQIEIVNQRPQSYMPGH